MRLRAKPDNYDSGEFDNKGALWRARMHSIVFHESSRSAVVSYEALLELHQRGKLSFSLSEVVQDVAGVLLQGAVQ